MSWNYAEIAQRDQIAELKKQLAVNETKLAAFQDQLYKQSDELNVTKETLKETLDKLRNEADHALELQENLSRCTNELQKEKLARENTEKTLREARAELQEKAASVKESEHFLAQLSHTATTSQTEHTKLLNEKARLEEKVKELIFQIRRLELSPPSSSKPIARPRSSSLTNLKLATLEQDLEHIRATASASQSELDLTKAKLSKAQEALLRVENEKLVLERKMQENDRQLRDSIDERKDLEREVAFLREHNGSEERENELLTRLEEEEQKVALLEAELFKLSQSKEMKRSLENMRAQLHQEVAKRQAIEQRESDLVQEKEEALDELFEIRENMQELKETLELRNLRIQDLERLESKLLESLDTGVSETHNHSSVAPEIEKSVETMLAAINRLRLERDQLRMDFDYLQMETRFQIEALESQLARLQARNQQECAETAERQVETERLRQVLKGEREKRRKLQVAASVISLVAQHIHRENEGVRSELKRVIDLHNDASSRLQDNLSALQSQLGSKEEELASSSLTITSLEAELASKAEQLTQMSESTSLLLSSKDTEISQMQDQLSIASKTIESAVKERDALEVEARRLEAELRIVREKLEEMRHSYDRLQAVQATGLSSVDTTKALHQEIEECNGRVLRREQQIGEHQHEIKRLQTNLRLLEERVEELESDLEMQKVAMLEDCTTTRCERDDAKRALEVAEIEIDRLGASLARTDEQMNALQLRLTSSQSEKETSELARIQELAAMVGIIAERDCRIKALCTSLSAANAETQGARENISHLASELEATRSSAVQTVDDINAQKQETLKVITAELESKSIEMRKLSAELEIANAKEVDLSQSLEAQESELGRTRELVSALERDKTELLVKLESFETETGHLLEESSILRFTLEEERSKHTLAIKDLEQDLRAIQTTTQDELGESKKINEDLRAQLKQMGESLQSVGIELAESRTLCERLESDRKLASCDQTQEIAELQDQLRKLMKEVNGLQHSLQEEMDGRQKDRDLHVLELRAEIERHDSAVATETELRADLEKYKAELTGLQHSLDELNDVKETMQAEIDNLSAECHRAKLQNQCLEKQVMSNEKELSALTDEIATIRQTLSQSEKDCRAAQMKLVLSSQQHDQSISSLRSQLKLHEKDSEMVLELQEAVAGLKEQIGEMDELLRAKCTEIEENDDKFIELLKEKKKMTSKIESLTRKNQSLRKKLEVAEAAPKMPNSMVQPSPSSFPNAEATTPPTTESPVESLAFTKPIYSTLPTPARAKTPEGSRAVSTPFTSARRQSVATTPTNQPNQKDALATTSTIGKKRPLPEDSNPSNVPVTAIICEEPYRSKGNMSTPPMPSSSSMPSMPSMPSISTNSNNTDPLTPRARRPLQTLRSGFTPNRGQGNVLRPNLSQPSPVRKTATQALHIATAITEMTNSPATKRVFSAAPPNLSQKPPSRGWLGKIRGGNPLLRTRQQPSTEELI